MRRLAFLIILLFPSLWGTPLFAQTDSELDGWIKDLGSTEWRTREIAQRKLISADEKSRAKLEIALESNDLEVSTRASHCILKIGESFSNAVIFAKSDKECRRSHGRAALKNLFRINDKSILRKLGGNELQNYGGMNTYTKVNLPKDAAYIWFESSSEMPICISAAGRAQWEMVSSDTPVQMNTQGSLKRVNNAYQTLSSTLNKQYQQKFARSALSAVPMKIGRAYFFFLLPQNQRRDAVSMCANQLVEDLLSDGPVQLRAAWLLAQGALTDSEASKNIHLEFMANPTLTRLMWLALVLSEDETVSKLVEKQEPAHALKALASTDWLAHTVASKYLQAIPPAKRSKLLSPIIETSENSIELLTALWNVWGCELTTAARTRIVKFLPLKEYKALASATLHWFTKANNITDDELDKIWGAAKSQSDIDFFSEALILFKRKDISSRMLKKARTSIREPSSPMQQSFSAAILHSYATPKDLEVILGKLAAAKNTPKLASLQVQLFDGCEELSDDALADFTTNLMSSDRAVRALYVEALRRCKDKLRLIVAGKVIETAEKDGKFSTAKDEEGAENPDATKLLSPTKTSEHVFESWLIAHGVCFAAGDNDKMQIITTAIEFDNIRAASIGAVALVEALPSDNILKRLEKIQQSESPYSSAAAKAGYIAICTRAAYHGNKKMFRVGYERAILAAGRDSWQVQNRLQPMQELLNEFIGRSEKSSDMPVSPKIGKLEIKLS